MPQVPIIAIVDDDEGVRVAMASLIRSLGYGVRTYASAADFLGEASDREPSCMITDVQMSGMTGDQLQQELIARGRVFPILFMTAFPNEAVRRRVMAAGAACFLSKPAEGDTIIRCLEDALKGHDPA